MVPVTFTVDGMAEGGVVLLSHAGSATLTFITPPFSESSCTNFVTPPVRLAETSSPPPCRNAFFSTFAMFVPSLSWQTLGF